MKTLNRTEVDALIRLLDDSDLEIYQHIQTRLVDYGKDVIPLLENAWSSSMDAMMQERIENVIHKIQFDDLKWTTGSSAPTQTPHTN